MMKLPLLFCIRLETTNLSFMKKSVLLFLTLLLFSICSAQQIMLEVAGDATFNQSKFFVDEAGLDLSSVALTQNAILLSVTQGDYWTKKNNPNNKWKIHIFKQDNWDDELQLAVKRTGKGQRVGNNGNPNIHGGGNYQLIRNNETEFIYGKGEIQNIPLMLRLKGQSLTMGAGTYSSRIIFTVYESW